jgi:hypothetical protein
MQVCAQKSAFNEIDSFYQQSNSVSNDARFVVAHLWNHGGICPFQTTKQRTFSKKTINSATMQEGTGKLFPPSSVPTGFVTVVAVYVNIYHL